MVTAHAHVGVSYRRLDYWARMGYLRPHGEGCGSGRRRAWSEPELRVASVMARLVDAGLALPIAAAVARQIVESANPTGYARLAEGVYLSVVVDIDAATKPRRARTRPVAARSDRAR
jgi:hypothetical protein